MTLWERIDGGRPAQSAALFGTGLVFSLVTYLVTLVIVWAVLTGAETILLSEQPRIPVDQALRYANAIALALSIALLLRFVWRARRGPAGLLGRIGARRVRREEYPLTFDALDDMKIAAGLPTMPPVYMLDRLTVNAAVFMTGRELAVLVTYGFATKLTAEDQRAVFASLLGRQVFARLFGLQALAIITEPAHLVQRRLSETWHTAVRDGRLPPALSGVIVIGFALAMLTIFSGSAELGAWLWLVLYIGIPVSLGIAVLTWLSTIATYRTHVLLSHNGDAEGLMLLKDPRSMLRAIDNVIAQENEVVFGQGSGPLFYCWPREPVGFLTDPEASRVERLRKLVGAEGIDV